MSRRDPDVTLAAGLPVAAAIIHPTDSRTVTIVRAGCSGYWQIHQAATEYAAEIMTAQVNNALGVTKPQREAMQAGSMFGWNCPAADPATYDADGEMLPPDRDIGAPVYGADHRPENDDPGPYQT